MSGMYWYAVAASDDVAGLKNKGFCVTSDGEILYNEQYEYALARMYTNDGHGIVDVETSNFFFDKDASDRITINAEDPMTTPVLSYKLRMTDQYPDAEWFYFAADKSEEILEDGVPHPLYKSDGTLATKTDYADCEFEALNPMPSEFIGMYGRFTEATFSFATYQSTADVLHVEFTGLHQEEAEYCFADRLRIAVTASSAPALPTVSLSYAYPNQIWNYSVNIGAGASSVLRDQNGNVLSYDSTKSYSALNYYTSTSDSAGTITTNVSIGASGSFLALFNNGSSQITVQRVNVATCADSTSTVITVYSSNNNPYNAFKYTSDGTDYYYVLDGTQTDWTDDLESIGYHVLSVAYLDIQDKFVNWNTWVWLFENNSASRYVSFDSNKSYIFDSAYTLNGNKVNLTSHTITIGRPNSTIEILGLIDSYSGFTAYKIYYHAIPNS